MIFRHNRDMINESGLLACTWGDESQSEIKRNMRCRSEDSRRSSIDRIILELEEFKVEIERRFAKSKFNHTFVFPRKQEKPKKPMRVLEQEQTGHCKTN